VSKEFDAALKNLVRGHVADYRTAFRLPEVNTVLDIDLSTVTAATDIVLADANPPTKTLTTLDFQSGHDPFIDDRILMYQAVLRNRFHLPVHSVVFLLRPDSYRPTMTGRVDFETAEGRGKMDFRYELIRLWELPAERLLQAGIGVASLAVLGKFAAPGDLESGLLEVAKQLERRARTEVATPAEANDLLATVTVLMGLRVNREVARALIQRARRMEESTTYQLILEKGEARGEARGETKGARKTLLALAQKKLGRPTKKTLAVLDKINDLDRLVRMNEAILDVKTWDQLLAVE
jgi:predicted transposase YdaD